MSRAELNQEGWDSFWPEARGLMELHQKTLRGGTLDVDAELASRLCAAGGLRIFTARANDLLSSLVGYCLWYISPSLEVRGRLCAAQGPWFVHPSWQGSLGVRLYKYSLEELTLLGVHQAFPHFWQGSPKGLDKFFRGMGAEPLEQVYVMKLENK